MPEYLSGIPEPDNTRPRYLVQHTVWCAVRVKASLFYLKDNKLVDYIPDTDSINAFTERMSTLIKSIHAEQFAACPGQVCRYCDYRSLCEALEKDLERGWII